MPNTAAAEQVDARASAFDIDLPFTSYDETHPLHFSSSPFKAIEGFWYIVGSSLPLWKSKKDVVIRYIPHTGTGGDEVRFSNEIRSESRSKPAPAQNVQPADLPAKWKSEEGFMNKLFGIKGTNVLQKDAKNG